MEYRFSKDPLFGKYCYIDTPWIAGKNTIYRIVNSGVRSNAWVEVPISGREEVVLHDYQEDVVFVVLDTLISEDSRIKKVALKDVEIADTPQTEVEDGEDYLRGYNDGYYARGVLDKAGVEIHIDKPRGFTLKSISDTPQTDCPWK